MVANSGLDLQVTIKITGSTNNLYKNSPFLQVSIGVSVALAFQRPLWYT